MKRFFSLLLVMNVLVSFSLAQGISSQKLSEQIKAYKSDIRGPYLDIRWFCDDGSTRAARDPCPNGKGVQRARYKPEIIKLGETEHLYWGQILATTSNAEFWDAAQQQSRFKQYQLDQYLRQIDDGWILRKAQYYRGAIQSEDENAWGKAFLLDLLSQPRVLKEDYFLLSQAFRTIPHGIDSERLQQIRSVSKQIADEYSGFQEIRIKIHGQPGPEDIALTQAYLRQEATRLSATNKTRFDRLISLMEAEYAPKALAEGLASNGLKSDHPYRLAWGTKIKALDAETSPALRLSQMSAFLWELRQDVLSRTDKQERYFAMELSRQISLAAFRLALSWEPTSLRALMLKIESLSQATAASGLLEVWEWEAIAPKLSSPRAQVIDLDRLNEYQLNARRVVEWGSGMIRANYQALVNQYEAFEPLSAGFIDDQVRSSLLLPLGNAVSQLASVFSKQAGLNNQIMSFSDPDRFRGLNPGYALGELVVVTGDPDHQEVEASKIYVFQRPPAEMKPVAGILTVSEGNLVSHVQLLARNLGIPNAVLGQEDVRALLPFNGQKVFLAVSNQGTVIMKKAAQMSEVEKALFAEAKRKEEKVRVPENQLRLEVKEVLNMRAVTAVSSGSICGPKAANLGELKKLYPDKVVEGLVIPFGIFRAHMDQEMPGENASYWTFLQNVFTEAQTMRSKNRNASEVESFVLQELNTLRLAIKKMPLLPDFERDLELKFRTVLAGDLGKVPVFLRSDTNMEDLKEFTGAGLNLTLFNVLEKDKILQGIKDVWASPYTERSYRWRQAYLLNPENVYPSILIIPSVNNDYSGVLITKGVQNDQASDLTIAFSRGVGGAVDGQLAETYLLSSDGQNQLLSPARELRYLSLPKTGSTAKLNTHLNQPLVKSEDMKQIREFSAKLKQDMMANTDSNGPFDVELGFEDGKLWLFQVRPFVENKRAKSSEYLLSISPKINGKTLVPLSLKL